MPELGLRERKRAKTRQHIADTAARLFGVRGYEQVSVAEVARAADVAEQTVYNYFGGKEQLVTDRDSEIEDRLVQLIGDRPEGVNPAAAIREYLLASVEAVRDVPEDVWRGDLANLAAVSPAVRRLALAIMDQQARAVAAVIARTSDASPEIAQLQGIAISGVFQVFLDEAGTRSRLGRSRAEIADELRVIVARLIDELDRWLTPAST